MASLRAVRTNPYLRTLFGSASLKPHILFTPELPYTHLPPLGLMELNCIVVLKQTLQLVGQYLISIVKVRRKYPFS